MLIPCLFEVLKSTLYMWKKNYAEGKFVNVISRIQKFRILKTVERAIDWLQYV